MTIAFDGTSATAEDYDDLTSPTTALVAVDDGGVNRAVSIETIIAEAVARALALVPGSTPTITGVGPFSGAGFFAAAEVLPASFHFGFYARPAATAGGVIFACSGAAASTTDLMYSTGQFVLNIAYQADAGPVTLNTLIKGDNEYANRWQSVTVQVANFGAALLVTIIIDEGSPTFTYIDTAPAAAASVVRGTSWSVGARPGGADPFGGLLDGFFIAPGGGDDAEIAAFHRGCRSGGTVPIGVITGARTWRFRGAAPVLVEGTGTALTGTSPAVPVTIPQRRIE